MVWLGYPKNKFSSNFGRNNLGGRKSWMFLHKVSFSFECQQYRIIITCPTGTLDWAFFFVTTVTNINKIFKNIFSPCDSYTLKNNLYIVLNTCSYLRKEFKHITMQVAITPILLQWIKVTHIYFIDIFLNIIGNSEYTLNFIYFKKIYVFWK